VTHRGCISDTVIVKLHQGTTRNNLRDHLDSVISLLGHSFVLISTYDHLITVGEGRYGIPHYAAWVTPSGRKFLVARREVEKVENDKQIHALHCHKQKNPDWGLSRINQRGSFNPSSYNYNDTMMGVDVDVYIIDTGIYCENNDFVNKAYGNCTYGVDVIDGSHTDGNGHGTHCAGTVAGSTYGVAKGSNLIAVRVLDDDGDGSTSGIIDGINWMLGNVALTGRRSVANLSLGGSYSELLNAATSAAVSAGVVMVVAAGNDDDNACEYSPASEPSALTVGATDASDDRAGYSNYGECLDIFAPGTSITSTYIGSPSAIATMSGTSMAAPHVTGAAAAYLSRSNYTLTATEIGELIISDATYGVLNGVNGSTADEDISPNLLAYVSPCDAGASGEENSGGVFHNFRSSFRSLCLLFVGVMGLEVGIGVPLQPYLKSMSWRLVIVVVLCQVVLVPLLAMGLVRYFNLWEERAIALLLLSACPSSDATSTVSRITSGSLLLSSGLTFFSNTVAVVALPVFSAFWVLAVYGPSDAVSVSWYMFIAIMIWLAVGCGLGVLVRERTKSSTWKCVDWLVNFFSFVLSTALLVLGIQVYGEDILNMPPAVWISSLIMQIGGGIFGLVLSGCASLSLREQLAVSLETSLKAFVVAVAVIEYSFNGVDKDGMMAVPLVYGVVIACNMCWCVPLLYIVNKLSKKKRSAVVENNGTTSTPFHEVMGSQNIENAQSCYLEESSLRDSLLDEKYSIK